jgi:hypothetical protein
MSNSTATPTATTAATRKANIQEILGEWLKCDMNNGTVIHSNMYPEVSIEHITKHR